MLTPREREALGRMTDLAESDTEEWDRDGGHVEGDAESIATRRGSIAIARAALTRAPLAGPEVRAWRYERPFGGPPHRAHIESLPLDQIGEWDTPPDGYAVYVEGPSETPQVHLCDCPTLATARTIAELITLPGELAGYVLHGEDCPERCMCGSEDGKHRPSVVDDLDALTLFVRQARKGAAR